MGNEPTDYRHELLECMRNRDQLYLKLDALQVKYDKLKEAQKKSTLVHLEIWDEVLNELYRARNKFPDSDLLMVALTEEVGELAKALLDEPPHRVHNEAIQVMTVALRIILEGDDTLALHRTKRGLGPCP